jgi:6-phosphofructokinase
VKSNLLIGQSGGPTAVINATLAAIIRAANESAQFAAIYGLSHGLEGALTSNFIPLSHLSDEELNTLAHTPAAALGSSRRKLDESEYLRVIENFRDNDIHHFAYIGGNGSMWVAQHIAKIAAEQDYQLHVVGVPKTVDNDLPCTDHTPGYGSAARFLALASRDVGFDLESMQTFDDVVLLEAMGRDTGWLAAAAGLLKESDDDAPHLIYVPEIPFDETKFLEDVMRVHRRLGRVFIVIAEGIRDTSGKIIGSQGEKDALGRTIHGLSAGPAAYLTTLVRERLGLQTRFFRPGLIGRSLSACVSEVDRVEAYRIGAETAHLLENGNQSEMVILSRDPLESYQCSIGFTPLRFVVGRKNYLRREYMDEAGTMITHQFREYALPLIGSVSPVLRLRKNTKEIF